MVNGERPPFTPAAAPVHTARVRERKRHGRIAMTDGAAAAHASDVPGRGGRRRESRFTTRGNNNCSRSPTHHNNIIVLLLRRPPRVHSTEYEAQRKRFEWI